MSFIKELRLYGFFSLLLLYFALPDSVFSQDTPIASAMRQFESGNYREAESMFKNLLESNPGFVMLNYYYGACRTENGNYNDEDLLCLQRVANQNEPPKIHFYIGVQLHARNDWGNAVVSYKKYLTLLGLSGKKDIMAEENIKKCNQKINPFVRVKTIEPVAEQQVLTETKDKIEDKIVPATVKDTVVQSVALTGIKPVDTENTETEKKENPVVPQPAIQEAKSNAPGKTEPLTQVPDIQKPAATINFPVNERIVYRNDSRFQTDSGRIYFQKSVKIQQLADSLTNATALLREQYGRLNDAGVSAKIGDEIVKNEMQLYNLQAGQQALLNKSLYFERGYWDNQNEEKINEFIKSEENSTDTFSGNQEVNFSEEARSILLGERGKKEIKKSHKTEPRKAENVLFKVQIGEYKQGKIPLQDKKLIDKLSVIRKIDKSKDEKGSLTVSTGSLNSQQDAEELLSQLKLEGVKSGKVIVFLNEKKLTLEEAKKAGLVK